MLPVAEHEARTMLSRPSPLTPAERREDRRAERAVQAALDELAAMKPAELLGGTADV